MTDLKGHSAKLGVAVVTGASSGIGAVYADRLGRRGYDLILIARRRDRLEDVAHAVRQTHGVRVETFCADLMIPDDLARIADRLSAAPEITMLVNNAGVSSFVPVALATPAAAQAMSDVNIVALTRLTMAVLAGFTTRNAGTIINIASVAALGEMPGSAIYSGSKAFVLSFTRGLAAELAGTGIRVQVVLPARTATEGWDKAGVPLSAFDPATVMSAEACVDAALAGLDLGETITLPSVEKGASMLQAYDGARLALLGASQTGQPAARYLGR